MRIENTESSILVILVNDDFNDQAEDLLRVFAMSSSKYHLYQEEAFVDYLRLCNEVQIQPQYISWTLIRRMFICTLGLLHEAGRARSRRNSLACRVVKQRNCLKL